MHAVEAPTDVRALPLAELPALCASLREEIIAVCGRVGGHLGASLGAVELIVALHRVFKSPVDRLVFDVGHQAYAHKLITGRRARFDTLRQEGGVAPFLDPTESEHDAFGAGHACTALSIGLGLIEAKHQQGQVGQVVAVVGDGAFTGGLTFEALNNLGSVKGALKVVLNDNGMSISQNVGLVPHMLRSQPRVFFEALGVTYIGPVDGHSLPDLLSALADARTSVGPVLVHVITQKGKGFGPAEGDATTRGHAMGPFELRDGKLVRSRKGAHTFSDAFAAALEEKMAADPKIVAITPAMVEGSSLTALAQRFPDRVFDVGIAEQHAVTFAAGLARGGLTPVVCIYSTFLQRAIDQVVHDVALPKLKVIFGVDRAGLVGADGATHQGAWDVPMLRTIPNLAVSAAVTEADLSELLDVALAADGPTAIRFPRGLAPTEPVLERTGRRARWLKKAADPSLCFVCLGPLGLVALEAAAAERWNVLDARWAEPLDEAALAEAAACGALVVVEEGSTRGGLGSAVLEWLSRARLQPRVSLLGLPDEFVRHGEARAQRARLGLDVAGLRDAAVKLLAPR